MAEKKAPSELSIGDLDAIFKRMGKKEKQLMRDLAASEVPHQGMVLAQLFHYFPGARIVDDKHS